MSNSSDSVVPSGIDYDTLIKSSFDYDVVMCELLKDKIDNISRQITEYYHVYIKPQRMNNNGGPRYNNKYRKSPRNHNNTNQYNTSNDTPPNTSTPLTRNTTAVTPAKPSKYKLGLSTLKAKSDPVKVELNDVLNKITLETVDQSINTVKGLISGMDTEDEKKKYLDILWEMLFHKMFTQPNFTDVHIQFLAAANKQRELYRINTHMLAILTETLIMLQDPEYFSSPDGNTKLLQLVTTSTLSDNLAISVTPFEDDTECVTNEYGQDTQKLETLYNLLGKLSATFIASSRSDKNKLLAALYNNFQQMNTILQWQPVNMVELNARLYYVIGVFTDNRKFIRGLSRDYYKDMECQLETIKDQDIPSAIKYKIVNCVDNIIKIRLDNGMSRPSTSTTNNGNNAMGISSTTTSAGLSRGNGNRNGSNGRGRHGSKSHRSRREI